MSDPTASAQQTDAGATGGTQPGAGTPPAPQSEDAKLTQEQFNAALAAEKRKWQQAQAATVAEEKRKAAEAEAAVKGEFEKLATERGTRLEAAERERTQAAERAEAYATAMESQIKARVKALPEELRDLMIDGDVLIRFEQLAKLESAAAKLTAPPPQPRQTPPGGRTAATAGNTNLDAIIAEKRARVGGL